MRRRERYEENKIKKTIYILGTVLILSVVIFLTLLVIYSQKMKEDAKEQFIGLGQMKDIVSNDELEETDYSTDKNIEETIKNNTIEPQKEDKTNNNVKKQTEQKTQNSDLEKNKKNNENEEVNNLEDNNIKNNENVENNIVNENNEIKNAEDSQKTINEANVIEDFKFQAPIIGEIIKDFADTNLVFSKTLEEWTTHPGIDIKADKTSIVTASERGVIESIKNDPRYGLTVIINHNNGFKTVYSNLLTTEFVEENETVDKGQTIGTIGDTASFEIADDSHLHFEIYKDNENVNPTIYLK